MKTSLFTKSLMILSGVGMLGGFAAVLAGFPSIGFLLVSVSILASVWSLAFIMRRSMHLVSTRTNNLYARVSALKADYDELRRMAVELNDKVVDLKRSQSASENLLKSIEASIDEATMPSPENRHAKQQLPSRTIIAPNLEKTADLRVQPSTGVLGVGLAEEYRYLGGQAVRHITPFSIPAIAEVKSGSILVVEESGFHRGVWKSFGEQYDTYVLESLCRLSDLVERRALNVHIVLSDNTPAHLRQPRSWGSVAESIEEVESSMSSLPPALRRD